MLMYQKQRRYVESTRDKVRKPQWPGLALSLSCWGILDVLTEPKELSYASNLADHDGEGIRLFRTPTNLLSASGDLRNIVKTIAELPCEYKGSIEVTINDRDSDIVNRNIILLLIALMIEDKMKAVDCMLNLWYSAFIRETDLNVLQQKIRPLVKNVWDTVKQGPPFGIYEKVQPLGDCSVAVYLEKELWERLLSSFEVPAGLTTKRAQAIHLRGMHNNARKDYRNRFLWRQSTSHQLAYNRFWQDGLLLPVGSPLMEFCNPLNGWSSEATSDIYGKLFFYLRETLHKFIDRLRGSKVSFKLFRLDVEDLTDALKKDSFNRIEVSNICDVNYMNIHRTLLFMVPFLQLPADNPHATSVTLFMNAVPMIPEYEGKILQMGPGSNEAKRLLKYMPLKPTSPGDPDLFKFMEGMEIVTNYNRFFDRYMKELEFKEAGEFFGAQMKAKHTITGKWPYQLKLKPSQPGAKEEFERLLCSGMTSKERYVEWKRLPALLAGRLLLASAWG
ncbi:hypothetical protein BDW69DRAFT_194896 [Aspergillus filifer]